jgi:hypothetical protein
MPIISDPLSVNREIKDDVILWRYLSFAKYIDLLTKSTLWFSRIDLLGDRFEGSTTHASYQLWKKLFQESIPNNHLPSVLDQLASNRKQITGFAYASCWHECDSESMLMWRTYSDKNGIAIRTTFGDLKQSIVSDKSIFANRVQYLNYDDGGDLLDDTNLFSRISSRPNYLSYEKEVRLAFLNPFETNKAVDFSNLEPGVPISINLKSLINVSIIRPEADIWISELLSEIHKLLGLDEKIEYSEFQFDPIW